MEASLDAADTLNAVDNCVASVNSTYLLFMTSVIGEFHRYASANVSKQTVRYFYQSCKQIQVAALASMTASLSEGLRSIEASLPVDEGKQFLIIKSDLTKKLKKAYQAQMSLDIEAVRSDIFRYTLAVTSRVDLGDKQASAMIAATKSVRFNFVDRAGKKWNSNRYIITMTRFEIIKGIYFSAFLNATALGKTQLILSNGQVIELSEIDQYSHPNAKLIPIQLVSSISK